MQLNHQIADILYNCRMSDIESNKVVGKGNIMSKEIEID